MVSQILTSSESRSATSMPIKDIVKFTFASWSWKVGMLLMDGKEDGFWDIVGGLLALGD